MGRSSDDHCAAAAFATLATFATPEMQCRQIELVQQHTHRLAFLPLDFDEPLETDYSEDIAGSARKIWVGSAVALLRDLSSIAPALGIPMERDILSDDVARRIDRGELLSSMDTGTLVEVERPAWLLLFEAARLAVAQHLALVLAG
jgi:hypothetical protein